MTRQSHTHYVLASMLGAGVFIGAGSLVYAQQGTGGNESTLADLTAEQAMPVPPTPEGKLALGKQVAKQGKQLSHNVSNLLDQSRQAKDVIQMTCLEDKLTQANVNSNNAEQHLGALRQAIQTKDSDRQVHEATVLGVLGRKFNVLQQEAGQCVGQDLYETGKTKVVMTVDAKTPRENAGRPAFPDMPSIPMVPPPSSPIE